MSQIIIQPANIPEWMKKKEKDVTTDAFDSLINTSGKYITQAIFEREFLPIFAANEDVPEDAMKSFIARWIHYAHQPYNAIDVYRHIDHQGQGIDFLFTVPPLWNPNAPILKQQAAQPPRSENGEQYEKDPSLFRTLVARINQLTVANDQITLLKHRDHFLPAMVEEAVAIDIKHLQQWHHILTLYKIENELSQALDRLLSGRKDTSTSNQSQDVERGTAQTVITGSDDF